MPLLDPEDDVIEQRGYSRSLCLNLVALNVYLGGYFFGVWGESRRSSVCKVFEVGGDKQLLSLAP